MSMQIVTEQLELIFTPHKSRMYAYRYFTYVIGPLQMFLMRILDFEMRKYAFTRLVWSASDDHHFDKFHIIMDNILCVFFCIEW